MKKLILISLLAICVFGCEDREQEPVIVPVWMTPELLELKNLGTCEGCKVQRWTYNEKYYYIIYCLHWSCLDCHVYNAEGTLITWDGDVDHADFDQNKYRPVVVWQCGDEL